MLVTRLPSGSPPWYSVVMKTVQTTLLLVIKDGQILLARKKRGFGVGKYNGAGGKLEPGETVEQAMLRETREEIGITPTAYRQVGVVNFDQYIKGEPTMITTHIYTASAYQGTPQESEEMRPEWFALDQIPYAEMYPTDQRWFPLVLAGQNFFDATYRFDPAGQLIDHQIHLSPL